MSNAAASAIGATSGDEPSLTASTIDAQAIGSHILRINGYSYTMGLGTGKFITSECFTVGGHRWCLKYFPNGTQKGYPASISIFLCLVHTALDEVKAKFTISLLDQAGNPVPSYIRHGGMWTFSHKQGGNAARGYSDFIRRSDLENHYVKDDVFSVRCDVAVPLGKTVTKAILVSAVRRGV
ncbi:BTB/POZ and MATH domain-containing protein 2 [Aegilops tauschii subsp. strangulata]|uniref:MATH domain-containing protein n=2 Tax=Aegilops tauschii TaxID=37682 RepID=A0A453SUL7_AEGTS|nr:BTB/POZ and MATH domain-containing protein 2 [Aegilops tauschii subsp. strangulata]